MINLPTREGIGRGHEQKKVFFQIRSDCHKTQDLSSPQMTNIDAKQIVKKKLTTSIPLLMSKLVKKYAQGPFFQFVGSVPAYRQSMRLFCLIILSRIYPRTRLSLVHKCECIKSKLHTRLNTSGKHPVFRQNSISEKKRT